MIELIPDPEFGGFTARVPDIPAYGRARQKPKQSPISREPSLDLWRRLARRMPSRKAARCLTPHPTRKPLKVDTSHSFLHFLGVIPKAKAWKRRSKM
jgi:hypothetical protein